MTPYSRTWRTELRPLDPEPEAPTGRAASWPALICILVILWMGFMAARHIIHH